MTAIFMVLQNWLKSWRVGRLPPARIVAGKLSPWAADSGGHNETDFAFLSVAVRAACHGAAERAAACIHVRAGFSQAACRHEFWRSSRRRGQFQRAHIRLYPLEQRQWSSLCANGCAIA